MKGFTKQETELLLSEVLNAPKNGKNLSTVFQEVADKSGRAKGSVRNYYYNIIKNEDKKREFEKSLNGVSNLKSVKAKAFSKEDEEYLLSSIEEGKQKGKSVRSTIMEISNGDAKLALRYQNKYRNHLAKNKDKLPDLPVRAEDFKYFERLSKEIDSLVEKIKQKYADECLKLKKENDNLLKELNFIKHENVSDGAASFFLFDKGKVR